MWEPDTEKKLKNGGGRMDITPKATMTDCCICYEPVIDHPACGATGSYRSSCGHVSHPACIAKWHRTQSTCPMCRKQALDMEDCAVGGEDDQDDDKDDDEDDDEDDEEDDGGVIRISRAGLELILRQAGGVGMTAGVEAELEINDYNEVVIARFELERILQEQGGHPLTDAQWTQLISIYPPAEYDDDEVVEVPRAPLQLTFDNWGPDEEMVAPLNH